MTDSSGAAPAADGRRRRLVVRRLRTIPLVYAGAIVLWLAAPLLLIVALAVDVVRWIINRTPFMAVRLLLFALAYVTSEAVGILILFAGWVRCGFGRDHECLLRTTFAGQQGWAGFMFWAVGRVLRLSMHVEGAEAVAEPPFILLSRHASILDNLLPAHFVSRPHGIPVRYVLKDELLQDPALDIAGNRLPNYFVRRGSGEGGRGAAAIRSLAATMGDDEAVLIYPEGTRFTPDRQARALKRLNERRPDLHARAVQWRHVLPPRLTGTLALLEGSDADVVVLAHRGLGGFARVGDIWRGGMVGHRVDARFRRIPRRDILLDREAREAWLYDVWSEVDRWIGKSPPAAAEDR